MKAPKNTFCALPWVSLEIRTNGTMAPCCSSRFPLKSPDGQTLDARKDSIEDAMSSPDLLRLRRNLSRGIADPNCERCWQDERSGAPSRRKSFNRTLREQTRKLRLDPKRPGFVGGKALFLDLKFSNSCNQKCRICGPESSSLWAQEMAEMAGESPPQVVNWAKGNPRFWEEIRELLPSTRLLYLFGGEPFLIPQCEKILTLAAELGVSKKMTVRMSSNASVFPEKYVKSIFPRFKKVEILLSIDGIGRQFEYQRHPASWKQALSVYRKFKKTGYFSAVCLSVSAFNVFDVPEYIGFWHREGEEKIALNTVFSPEYQSVTILPPELKKRVAERLFRTPAPGKLQREQFEYLIRFMHQASREDLWPQFVQNVRAHDRFRKQDFREVFPEYYAASKEFWK